MRAVIQRVSKAHVMVGNELISSIGRGICVLVGISRDDNAEDIEYVVRKLLNLRMYDNVESNKKWDKSVKDLGLEILCVSQFTLHTCLKGNKLDFHRSMSPQEAPQFYEDFMTKLRDAYMPERIKDGVFGAMMSVGIENDGPVTIVIDSKSKE
ncbi:d-Tyr-tRNA(Tyr) deacylase domain-containing protein [Ditylenchus destructor]|uniref:D-aminoacyl-tRNA deacylase n=1 Tax=Ditylenchus destructor TaxID=166010 RepID=A0AAD4R741_9BILA|nr:d-Tyr-tRNA(Tyr) deacylase domain-containing protein [Ditylenchus destructor]